MWAIHSTSDCHVLQAFVKRQGMEPGPPTHTTLPCPVKLIQLHGLQLHGLQLYVLKFQSSSQATTAERNGINNHPAYILVVEATPAKAYAAPCATSGCTAALWGLGTAALSERQQHPPAPGTVHCCDGAQQPRQ